MRYGIFSAPVLGTLLFGLPLCTWAQRPIITETTPGVTPPPPSIAPRRRRPRPRPKPAAPAAPKLLWKTFLRRCDATPALAEEVAFTTAGNYLYQLDPGGRTLWATEIGPTQATPALDDNRVYVGTDRGVVYGLNRRTGQPIWKFTGPANPVQTAPAIGGGRVYVESSDNIVYGLAAATGGQIWKFPRPDGSLGYSGVVYAGEHSLYVGGDNTLYRIDAATGKEIWHLYVGGKSLSTPAVEGDQRVYVGGDNTGISAISQDQGKTLWNFRGKMPGDWFGAPLFAEGVVYVTTYNRYVYAIDAATGKQKWSYRLLGNALAAPVLDAKRHMLFVSSTTFRENPTLTALDSRSGVKLWDYKAGYINGSPALSADRVCVGSTDGYFYAFSLK